MNIDLHCHSYISDGVFSPAEVVEKAYQNGASMLALTDHDQTAGLAEAREQAKNHQSFRFINGTEVSVSWQKRNIHIVGLNFTDTHPSLESVLKRNQGGRLQRLEQISHKLAKQGIQDVYEGALSYTKNPEMVGRAHIARFLLDNGYVDTMQKAFDKWLGDGKSASVHHEWCSLKEAVQAIIADKGIAVIAHPARYKLSATALRHLIEEFKELGGQALEVASSSHSLNERLNFAIMANKYGLYSSLGSDFHGNEPFRRVVGCPPELPVLCRPVWLLFDSWIQE